MILSELRANAYKVGTILFGALAVALLIACLFLKDRATRANVRADAQSARAEASEARAKALSDALARDKSAAEATDAAIKAMHASADAATARLARLEGRLNDRPPVPAVCPSPDADLLRESAESASRFRAAERELWGLRGSEGQRPE